MPVLRRLKPLLVILSLAAASLGVPGGAAAQSTSSTLPGKPPAVNQMPQLSPTPGTTAAPPATTTTPKRPPARTAARPLPSALPNTGMDGRILAAAGLGLLLCGIGLRLRTGRERF